jgi:predicted regulator of Ras-like GTPase activity (Roadblock/LC7/MglB family)
LGREPIEDLRGSLTFTTLTDVMQFLHTTQRTGELWVEGGPDQHAAQIYFVKGNVPHAQVEARRGIEALVEIISWLDGNFVFSSGKPAPAVTIEVSLPNALVEAARRLDERRRREQEREDEQTPQRLIDGFAESSGVMAAILMASDGSTVAAANPDDTVDMTALGAGLAELTAAADRLGESQACRAFDGFFIEYDRFQLFCLPVAADTLVVVAPGRAQLGVIRHKTQHLAEALAEMRID